MKKNILIFGILNAIAIVFYSLISIYFYTSNSYLIMLFIALNLLLAVAAAFFYRKQKLSISSFRNIFLVTLSGLTLGSVLGTFLIIFHYMSLSEESKMLLENQYLENQMNQLSSISDSLSLQDQLEKSADDLFSISHQISGIFMSLIFNMVLSAIVALCMKKE